MAVSRVLGLFFLAATVSASPATQHIHIRVPSAVDSALSNVHVDYLQDVKDLHTFTYGTCDATNSSGSEIFTSSGANVTDHGNQRFVWVTSDNDQSGGCISVWKQGSNELLGRSNPIEFTGSHPNVKRDGNSIAMTNASGIDAEGPWFDGVKLLKNKEIGAVDVKAAKCKSEFSKPIGRLT